MPDPTESVSLIRRRLERVFATAGLQERVLPGRSPFPESHQGRAVPCSGLPAPRISGASLKAPQARDLRDQARAQQTGGSGFWGRRENEREGPLVSEQQHLLGGPGRDGAQRNKRACGVIASGSYPGRQTPHVPSLPSISPKSSSEATVCCRLCRDPAVSLRWAGRCSRWGQRQSRLPPCRVGACPQPPVVVPVSVW